VAVKPSKPKPSRRKQATKANGKRDSTHDAEKPRLRGDKYQRILDAAISVFAEKGFHSSRVSDVAARASVADGTIYLYFRNKDELLVKAIETAFDAFMRRVRTELAAITSPAAKLRCIARLHLEDLGSKRPLAVVIQMEFRRNARLFAPFLHSRMVEYFDLMCSIIRDGQAKGLFHPGIGAKIIANCFFGALDEMVTSWVLDESQYRLSDVSVADTISDIILSGLQIQTH